MKLELREVNIGYASDKPIAKNVNLTLNTGETCCILGPNGVGKSTLFKTILQLIPPLSGRITIDGEDISRWGAKKRSRYLAYVAQAHVPVYPYRVEEMVMMGRIGQISTVGQPTRQDYEICTQALEDVGIRHLQGKLYTEISGGERQLLMIARALAQQPKFLVMDEPTANLDYGNMVRVMECIRGLADRGISVIFTSHLPDQAFMSQAKVALMRRNAPVLYGTSLEVVTERNLYEAYQTEIQILEVIDHSGRNVRVVTPRFR